MPIVLGKVSPKFKVISYMRPCLHHRKVSVESGLDMTPVKSHMAVSRLRHQSCSGGPESGGVSIVILLRSL